MQYRIVAFAFALLSVASLAFSDDADPAKQAKRPAGFTNLHKLGLAMHGYHDIFGRFPSAVLYAPDGKTKYSWRVELLPVLKHYVDGIDSDALNGNTTREQYNALIKACGYDTDQPWNSEPNREILNAMPAVYRHPGDDAQSNHSAFYAIVGSGTAFDPNVASTYTDIRAWPGTTLMLAESRSREPWTKPIDIGYSADNVIPRFGGFSSKGFMTVSCDGAVHFVSDAVSPADIRSYITRDQSDRFSILGIPAVYE